MGRILCYNSENWLKERNMEIRKARIEDVAQILEIYEQAKAFMRQQGNLTQWTGGYPGEETILGDIARGDFYLCTEENDILGVFCFFCRPDPTYAKIYDGAWLNDEPYGVIHRIAVKAHRKGVAAFCYAYALNHCTNLRIDTHQDNIPMQRSLAKNGFTYCGVIHLANGDPRIAFQKIKNTI